MQAIWFTDIVSSLEMEPGTTGKVVEIVAVASLNVPHSNGSDREERRARTVTTEINGLRHTAQGQWIMIIIRAKIDFTAP